MGGGFNACGWKALEPRLLSEGGELHKDHLHATAETLPRRAAYSDSPWPKVQLKHSNMGAEWTPRDYPQSKCMGSEQGGDCIGHGPVSE